MPTRTIGSLPSTLLELLVIRRFGQVELIGQVYRLPEQQYGTDFETTGTANLLGPYHSS
jgi:hypothetical protein